MEQVVAERSPLEEVVVGRSLLVVEAERNLREVEAERSLQAAVEGV